MMSSIENTLPVIIVKSLKRIYEVDMYFCRYPAARACALLYTYGTLAWRAHGLPWRRSGFEDLGYRNVQSTPSPTWKRAPNIQTRVYFNQK